MSKQKVFWTRSENEKIAEYLWNATARPGDRDFLRRARQAQLAVLPPTRQRVLTGSYSMRAVNDIMLAWAKAGRSAAELSATADETQKAASSPGPVPPPTAEAMVPRADPGSSEEPSIERRASPAGGLLTELDQTLRALARALTARFLDHFQEEITQQAKGRLAGIISSVSPAALKVRQPRVLIMGLKPQQSGLMQQEFGACLDLRFWKDEGVSKLVSLARNADNIIGMTDFIGHSDEDPVKAFPEYQRLGGGMTGLREALTQLYVKMADGPDRKNAG